MSEIPGPNLVTQRTDRLIDDNHDSILAALLHTMTSAGASFGITLIVDGLVVSGIAISAVDYFEGLGAQFDAGWKSAGARDTNWAANLRELAERASKSSDPDAGGRQWVYLKQAVVVVSGDDHLHFPFWRGQLSHIGGWALGNIEFDDENEDVGKIEDHDDEAPNG